jgi:hypothetical protein
VNLNSKNRESTVFQTRCCREIDEHQLNDGSVSVSVGLKESKKHLARCAKSPNVDDYEYREIRYNAKPTRRQRTPMKVMQF